MTCIVGVVDGSKVWMGGDSAGVASSYSMTQMAEPKIFINSGFLFGYTTSFRMGQLLQHKFKPPHMEEGKDLMAYMVCEFIDGIRQVLKESGYSKKQNEEESAGTFLVGHKGRLFKIEDYYSIIESANGYSACGCGDDFAKGSLFQSQGLKARDRVLAALKAADHHSAGVSAPFHVLSV